MAGRSATRASPRASEVGTGSRSACHREPVSPADPARQCRCGEGPADPAHPSGDHIGRIMDAQPDPARRDRCTQEESTDDEGVPGAGVGRQRGEGESDADVDGGGVEAVPAREAGACHLRQAGGHVRAGPRNDRLHYAVEDRSAHCRQCQRQRLAPPAQSYQDQRHTGCHQYQQQGAAQRGQIAHRLAHVARSGGPKPAIVSQHANNSLVYPVSLAAEEQRHDREVSGPSDGCSPQRGALAYWRARRRKGGNRLGVYHVERELPQRPHPGPALRLRHNLPPRGLASIIAA
jgi:hypothetical protein